MPKAKSSFLINKIAVIAFSIFTSLNIRFSLVSYISPTSKQPTINFNL